MNLLDIIRKHKSSSSGYEINERNEVSPPPTDLSSFNSFISSPQREDASPSTDLNSFNSFAHVREAIDRIERMKRDRKAIVETIKTEGRRLCWPSVMLAPFMRLCGSESSWQTYLDCPHHGPDEFKRLLEAVCEFEKQQTKI